MGGWLKRTRYSVVLFFCMKRMVTSAARGRNARGRGGVRAALRCSAKCERYSSY